MEVRSAHSRIARIVAVVVAGGAVGLAGTIAVAGAGDEPSRQSVRQRAAAQAELADWARANGVTGLSPASLSATNPELASRAADLQAIAEWARSEGLVGLSPASLRPSDD